jgi:hypothetical protein
MDPNESASASLTFPPPASHAATARVWWLGLSITLAPLLLYNLLFFNRYFPLTEGWFSMYARLIRAGQVPYRDFSLFLPPLYPLQLAAITSVFGDEFVVLRIVGVLVILGMGSLLYALLTRWFPAFAAAFATLVAMVYYQSGVAHITYDFTQFLTLYALLAVYFLVRHFEAEPNPTASWWKRSRLLAFAGIWAALAFLTKQSNGALIVAGSILATLVASWSAGWRCTVRNLVVLAGGMFLPVALTAGWLAWVGALPFAHDQILHGALRSKGNLGRILFAWAGLFNDVYIARLKTLAVYIIPPLFIEALVGCVLAHRIRHRLHGAQLNVVLLAILLPLSMAAVLVPYFWAPAAHGVLASAGPALNPAQSWLNYLIPLSTATSIVLVLLAVAGSILGRPFLPLGLAATAVFSLGLVSGNGTSAGLSEVGCFLGLAFVVAWLMSRTADCMVLKGGIVILGCSYIIFLAGMKYESPYAWWYIGEPDVRQATARARLPGLRGMRLSCRTAATVTEVVRAIQGNVPHGAPIFCFPHVPQFYLLTGHFPETVAKVHWFDFLPDDRARADAALLRRTPPAALIYVDLPEVVWTTHERLFRQGRPLGQRAILSAILDLRNSGRYAHRGSWDLGEGCSLHVWTVKPGWVNDMRQNRP